MSPGFHKIGVQELKPCAILIKIYSKLIIGIPRQKSLIDRLRPGKENGEATRILKCWPDKFRAHDQSVIITFLTALQYLHYVLAGVADLSQNRVACCEALTSAIKAEAKIIQVC